jgi:hypothetical protein
VTVAVKSRTTCGAPLVENKLVVDPYADAVVDPGVEQEAARAGATSQPVQRTEKYSLGKPGPGGRKFQSKLMVASRRLSTNLSKLGPR